mgnify:CR=1 FL=1
MRKSSLALLSLLLLLISSCNFPTSGAIPTSDDVATQVAQLLTDQAVTLQPTIAEDTPQPTTSTETEVVETNTETPLPTPTATVPPHLKKKYFMMGKGGMAGYHKVVPEVREKVAIKRQNLESGAEVWEKNGNGHGRNDHDDEDDDEFRNPNMRHVV